MEWHWWALAAWYASLGYVMLWNRRSRPLWRILDAYPLRMRIWMLLPFTRSWRARIRPEDAPSLLPFRRSFLVHCYGIALLPPILLYGWLYGTSWLDYQHSLARRDEHRRALFEILARRALIGDRAPETLVPAARDVEPAARTPDGTH